MKIFDMLIALPSSYGVLIEVFTEDVTVFFTPRCVVYLCYDGFHMLVGMVVTIIQAYRIEAIAKVSQMGEQTNRTGGPRPKPLLHQVSDRLLKWNLRVTQVVFAAEIRQVNLFA
jgi:hypothetical protein